MFDFLSKLEGVQLYIVLMVAFVIVYLIVMVIVMRKRKNTVNQWLEKNPTAVKIYVKNKSGLAVSDGIFINSIDDETPVSFVEGTKTGVYVLPGNHIIESTFTTTRPGVMHKSVTKQYGPSKQEILAEINKSYQYSFNKKTEGYEFTEL